jgi:uncharacterized integral membrane protein
MKASPAEGDRPPVPGEHPEPAETAAERKASTERKPAPTRLSAAWTAVVVAVVLLIFLVIFIAQNTQDSAINYLGAHGHAPTAVVILIAALAGAVIVIVVGMARLVQLRWRARRAQTASGGRHSRGKGQPAPVSSPPE